MILGYGIFIVNYLYLWVVKGYVNIKFNLLIINGLFVIL